MDDGALDDGDFDEGLEGVVLGGRLRGGGGCRREGGAGRGGWGVLAWARAWAGVVSGGFVLALPGGRLRQAAACGFGLGGWGCSCPYPSAVPAVIFWVVRHRCPLARCGPVCGLWCRCVAWWRGAFPGVRWLASVSPSG